MTGIIHVGVTKKGSFKKYSEAVRCISRSSKAVYNIKTAVNILRIYRAYAVSTYSRLICMNEGWIIT